MYLKKLTFLYDGLCPLCTREVYFLKKRDKSQKINFVNINDNYDSFKHKNISFSEAMANLHGILNNGQIIKGLDVLAYAYELVGLGWIYYPIKIPIISQTLKVIYRYWAKNRLKFTGRSTTKICADECERLL